MLAVVAALIYLAAVVVALCSHRPARPLDWMLHGFASLIVPLMVIGVSKEDSSEWSK
jgi:hypothetical protein